MPHGRSLQSERQLAPCKAGAGSHTASYVAPVSDTEIICVLQPATDWLQRGNAALQPLTLAVCIIEILSTGPSEPPADSLRKQERMFVEISASNASRRGLPEREPGLVPQSRWSDPRAADV